jgi:hypothetical protein
MTKSWEILEIFCFWVVNLTNISLFREGKSSPNFSYHKFGKKKKKKPWCSLRLCNFFNKKISDKKIEKILEILCFSILNLTNISLFYAKNSPNVLYQNFEEKKNKLKKKIFFFFLKPSVGWDYVIFIYF